MLDFILFQDVWNNYVYLDNNRIVGGIKVGSINLCLLFDEEQKLKVMELKKVLNSIDYPIKIFSVDKPILLDENINILIGTQMVVKGHHFPNVTLVGVIAADSSLNTGDYRANERTFDILVQVARKSRQRKTTRQSNYTNILTRKLLY